MFRTRLISGAILLTIVAVANYFGGYPMFVFNAFISFVGIYEFFRAVGLKNSPLSYAGYLATLAWWIVLSGVVPTGHGTMLLPIIAFYMVICLGIYVFSFPKYKGTDLFAAVFGFLYVTVMISCIFQTREFVSNGRFVVWLIYVASWGSDTSAYLVGRKIGKHKLAPVLSPHKSIEGAIGGIVGAALIGVLYGAGLVIFRDDSMNIIPLFAIIGGIGSMVSQVGDLAASGIKRQFEIKDYGKLIPGHGGILDRFDSTIITAPIVLYLSLLLIGQV